ncbi:MAG: hypothetical protein ACHQ1D_00865 [Nitrososphaerales archaeon]
MSAKVGGSISITSAGNSVYTGRKKHLLFINDGADEVYIALEQEIPAGSTATTTDFMLENGEVLAIDTEVSNGFVKVNFICQAGETASIRYLAWD